MANRYNEFLREFMYKGSMMIQRMAVIVHITQEKFKALNQTSIVKWHRTKTITIRDSSTAVATAECNSFFVHNV